MTAAPRPTLASIWRPATDFARTFINFAGARGLAAAGLVAAGALLDGAGLLLLIPILDSVVTHANGASRIGAVLERVGLHTPLQRLVALLAAFVLLSIVRALTQYARDRALARLQMHFTEHQRNAVMRALAAAPWSRIVSLRHARITNLITTEVGRVASGAHFLIQGSVAAAMLVVQACLAVTLSPALALATTALVLLGGGIVFLAQGKIRDIGAGMVAGNAALMGSASDFLSGLKAAAAQNTQNAFIAEFETIQAQARKIGLGFQMRQASSRRVFAIGSGFAAAAVVLIGFVTAVPPTVLITLVLIFARMSGPAILIQQSAQNFFFMLPSFEAMQRFQADMLAEHVATPAPQLPPPGPLEARDVVYRHPGGGGVSHASAVIAPGSFVGIAGPSGAGKTTLVDLLLGLTEPHSGTISVGGQVLDAAARAGWRETVAYVPQEGFLFHDTVRRNLAWGNRGPDEAAMWAALAFVGADALVRRMPAGLDTIVGERGALLSGGERQRLALARALLRQARLLVLDEAMNAIDAGSETLLLERLAKLEPRPTILMISHRAESMAACDQVIRVENGVVS
ncbi:ATP-binding cassette domain-containing protein [Sphingomonas sp.]|jgi:ATP-binding cassette subfamily C protein|uniref:ATP-binding cassette domain-containing protein n=1 Tax=Sphingomonas sp. TaxID=28214 RepID=UPI003568DEB9